MRGIKRMRERDQGNERDKGMLDLKGIRGCKG